MSTKSWYKTFCNIFLPGEDLHGHNVILYIPDKDFCSWNVVPLQILSMTVIGIHMWQCLYMHSVSAPNENVYTTQIVFLYEAISKDMLELTVQSMMVRQTCIYHAGIKNSVYEYQSQFLIITTSAVRILLHYSALSNSISALYVYVCTYCITTAQACYLYIHM